MPWPSDCNSEITVKQDQSGSMEEQTTICVCGYDRFRLAEDQPCPECGQIEIAKTRAGRIRALLRDNPSPTALISFVFGLITFALSTILTIVIIAMMVSLANSSGFGAPIGLIIPVAGYVTIILPAVGITGLLAIIPTRGRHWPLARFNLITIVVSAIVPVAIFVISLLFI